MKLIFYVTTHGLHSGYLIFKTHSESIQDHTDVEVERDKRACRFAWMHRRRQLLSK